MNTLNKKINNLKEVVEELKSKKRYEKNNNHYIFLIDNKLGGYYQTGVRLLEKKSNQLNIEAFIISTANYGSFSDLENILKKECFLIYKRNNNYNNNRNALLITSEKIDYEEIDQKIIDILLNTKGNKKDFKKINQDYLYTFIIKQIEEDKDFFNDGNIERLLMERQLKDF